MKKLPIIALLFSIVSCLLFFGCTKSNSLANFVTEARLDVYHGENDNVCVDCAYSYQVKDGKKNYFLTFKLNSDATTEITYTLSYDLGEKITVPFTLNPITHTLSATIPANNDLPKSFDVKIGVGSSVYDVNLSSIVPDGVLDISNALDSLYKTVPSLVDSYKNDLGEFSAKICVRILVKKSVPYYYVSFTDTSGSQKALLLNATTGEVLAIREIF